MDAAKQQIINFYLMKDLGPIKFYLNIKVNKNREQRTIQFTQTAAINRIFANAKITNYKFYTTPMENGL